MFRRLFVLSVVLTCAHPVTARDAGAPGPAPEKNFSFIHDGVEWVARRFKEADKAAANGDWLHAVRRLQPIIDAATRTELDPGVIELAESAPYVASVEGSRTFEGAYIVARHAIARWGSAAVDAYEREFGGAADDLLVKAVQRRDTALLETVAARFMSLPAGRRAALLRIDIALESGDNDVALEWLQALEDLEDVSAEDPDVVARRRARRAPRHARALARNTDDVPAIAKAMLAAPAADPMIDVVPTHLRRRARIDGTWLTTNGDASRAAVAPALGSKFKLRWALEEDLSDRREPDPNQADRTSIWLPPRAVATADHLLVSDGQRIHVYDIPSGKVRFTRPFPDLSPFGNDTEDDRRKRFGLLEGHSLTLHPMSAFGGPPNEYLLLCAVPDGEHWPITASADERVSVRNDRIQAFRWTGYQLQPLWRNGGGPSWGGIESNTRLYGAPLVYRGRVWMAGIRPGTGTGDQWEAWLFSFDPLTGKALSRTNIGTGTPVRKGRIDDVIPTSPAAACGRVVIGTALGMIAAVSARDGRIAWIYRYDRDVDTKREGRNRHKPVQGSRVTGFTNAPPLLALDRCYVTPTDGKAVLGLMDRPRGKHRYIEGWRPKPRLLGMAVEQIGGLVMPTSEKEHPVLVLVGQAQDTDVPGPIVEVVEATTGSRWVGRGKEIGWSEANPTSGADEPYGRVLVTEAEIFVPTDAGIAVFDLRAGDVLGVLDLDDVAKGLEAPQRPYGNLIPIPGHGLVAVSATTISFWGR